MIYIYIYISTQMLLPVFTAASTRKHPKEEKLWTSLVYGDGGEGESTLS